MVSQDDIFEIDSDSCQADYDEACSPGYSCQLDAYPSSSPSDYPEPLLLTDPSQRTSIWTCWTEEAATIEIPASDFSAATTKFQASAISGSEILKKPFTAAGTSTFTTARTIVTQAPGQKPGVLTTITSKMTSISAITTAADPFYSADDSSSPSSSPSLSTGVKAGIAIGGVMGAFAVLGLLILIVMRCMHEPKRRDSIIQLPFAWRNDYWTQPSAKSLQKSQFEGPEDTRKAKTTTERERSLDQATFTSRPEALPAYKATEADVRPQSELSGAGEVKKQHPELGSGEAKTQQSEPGDEVIKRPVSEMPVAERQSMFTELSSQPARDRMSELAG